jgi:hypothetical protein
MNFKPLSKEDAIESQLFPKGTYKFEIVNGCDKESRAGNSMLELKVKVTDANGTSRIVNDYLLEQWPVKLRRAAEACGLLEKYNAGELVGEDFIGKTGKLTLTIQKDKAKKFPDKNAVLDYVVPRQSVAGITFLKRRA